MDQVVFSYSDVRHTYVMHKASDGGRVRRGFPPDGRQSDDAEGEQAGGRRLCGAHGLRQVPDHAPRLRCAPDPGPEVVAVRHPMPYGDLAKQAVQRFATYADLDAHQCTIEEREEYEPHLDRGVTVYAGVDYEAILRQAEQ